MVVTGSLHHSSSHSSNSFSASHSSSPGMNIIFGPPSQTMVDQGGFPSEVYSSLFLHRLHRKTVLFLRFYTPPNKKRQGIMLYPPNFECPSVRPASVRLSVSASFPCSNFSTFWPIFFTLCMDIGIGEEWYEIASGLISLWNNRVMALYVCQKCFALRFHALTLVPFYRFSSTFA